MMKKVAIVTGGSRRNWFSALPRQLGVDGYRIVILATGEAGRYQEHFQLLDELEIEWHYVTGKHLTPQKIENGW